MGTTSRAGEARREMEMTRKPRTGFALRLLDGLSSDDPALPNALRAFVWMAGAEGWSTTAIDAELRRRGFAH